jgi:hypothetical protein
VTRGSKVRFRVIPTVRGKKKEEPPWRLKHPTLRKEKHHRIIPTGPFSSSYPGR